MARITLVVPIFPKLSETFIVNKFVGLVDCGLDVRIVAQKIDQKAWNHFPALAGRGDLKKRVHGWSSGVGIIDSLGIGNMTVQVLGQTSWVALRHILKGFKAQGPAILGNIYSDLLVIFTRPQVVHFEFGSLAVARPSLAGHLGAKMSASFRGYDLNYVGLEDPVFYEAVWSNLDAAHFLGQDLYHRAVGRGFPPSLPHVFIPPSIDTEFFSPRNADRGSREPQTEDRMTPTGSLRLLSVGRLEWKKGYEYALMAVRHLIDRGIPACYRIIGAGEYEEAIHFAIHQLGLEAAVEVMGAMPPEEVRSAMLSADVFVHAAVSEGFCNAVIEAQSMELAVVTSDADGLRENVEHGVTGFVVGRRDPEAMAEAIEKLAADPQLRARMGKAGRARALEHYQLPHQIDLFHRFYRDLLDRSARA